jgi:hypothetical protein
VSAAHRFAVEEIVWIRVGLLPDSDTTVLVFAPDADDPVSAGYHDGESWFEVCGREYGNPHEIAAPVIAWAELPRGPSAEAPPEIA